MIGDTEFVDHLEEPAHPILPFFQRIGADAPVMSIVALGLLSAVALYSVKYMEHDKGTDLYYALLLLMVAGIVGITMATDLIVL